MRNATLRLHGAAEVLEFLIVAFDEGGVAAWRIQDGHAIGRNIDFEERQGGSSENAIRNAACVLTLWHPGAASELVIEP